MNKTSDADLKFDGYVRAPRGPRVPCDVQIWLPKGPMEDASMSVFLNGPAEAVMGHGGVEIDSNEQVEALGLKFHAQEVLLRASRAQPGFRRGGAHLTITHVGSWVIHRVRTRAGAGDDALQYVKISLSPLGYGAQPSSSTVSYNGTRTVDAYGEPKKLRFRAGPGDIFMWELQKHWDWRSDKKDENISAYATSVLCLVDAPRLTRGDLSRLRCVGDDTCLLLSLAARHLTSPHVLGYDAPDGGVEEWRYPLQRTRSRTEEEAWGPLIAEDELETYFERASSWWSALDDDRKDAVRLAVFANHGTTERTLESALMSRFAALEGLAKRWGSGKHASDRFDEMVKLFPPASEGLWPVYDKTGGARLYWFRNEIAHGRTLMRFGDGLSVAAEHMQLWLERVLLALMGYQRVDQSDWLSQNVYNEQAEIARLRTELAARSSAASGAASTSPQP